MHELELIIALMFGVLILVGIAERIRIPYPILLIIFGGAVALVPGLPDVHLSPDLALVLFLPPVLMEAAYFTSWRDFKANLIDIGGLAIGAVLITTLVVGVVAHWIFPGMPWALAFALGAIVSPPDAVAASTIFRRMGVPHKITTVLEGESLVNDASALVTYRAAVAAILTGSFSFMDASVSFVVMGGGGVIVGIVAGVIVTKIVRWLDSSELEIAATFTLPYVVYILAERLEISGVLAVVAMGLVFSRYSSNALAPEARVGGVFFWRVGLILLNGVGFILMGLQLRIILAELTDYDVSDLLLKGVLISFVVILIRFVWIYSFGFLRSLLSSGASIPDREAARAKWIVLGWSGLRGLVSMATALALPLVNEAGEPIQYRDEVLMITFVVIMVTLVGQGLSLPPILNRLQIEDDGEIAREVDFAQNLVREAVFNRLREIQGEGWADQVHFDRISKNIDHKLAGIGHQESTAEDRQQLRDQQRKIIEQTIEAGRQALLTARDNGDIGDNARLEVENELDRRLLAMS